jgi:uncharacterized membrane protein
MFFGLAGILAIPLVVSLIIGLTPIAIILNITTVSGWQLHAILFSISFIIGGFAYVSGKKISPGSTAFKSLPDFVNRRFHIVTGIAFLPIIIILLVFLTVLNQWGSFQTSWGMLSVAHSTVGITSVALLVAGFLLGFKKIRKTFGEIEATHCSISMAGFYLFLISIVLGFAFFF